MLTIAENLKEHGISDEIGGMKRRKKSHQTIEKSQGFTQELVSQGNQPTIISISSSYRPQTVRTVLPLNEAALGATKKGIHERKKSERSKFTIVGGDSKRVTAQNKKQIPH